MLFGATNLPEVDPTFSDFLAGATVGAIVGGLAGGTVGYLLGGEKWQSFYRAGALPAVARRQRVRGLDCRGQRLGGVSAPGIPQHPALDAVVVPGAHLRPDLRRAISRRPEREVLIPRNDARRIRHAATAARGILERVVDGGVRRRVRVRQLVRSRREVGRVDHGQHDVRLVDEFLPLLADSHVRRVGGRQAEHVDRHRDPGRRAAHRA